jgi:uncharacterized membrane protein
MLSLSTRCNPIRISLVQKDTMTVTATVKNRSENPQLVSIDFELPGDLGFDEMGVSKSKSARLGEIPPGESAEAIFEVHPTHRARENEYSGRITAFAHYRDYDNVVEKTTLNYTIRVVE